MLKGSGGGAGSAPKDASAQATQKRQNLSPSTTPLTAMDGRGVSVDAQSPPMSEGGMEVLGEGLEGRERSRKSISWI